MGMKAKRSKRTQRREAREAANLKPLTELITTLGSLPPDAREATIKEMKQRARENGSPVPEHFFDTLTEAFLADEEE